MDSISQMQLLKNPYTNKLTWIISSNFLDMELEALSNKKLMSKISINRLSIRTLRHTNKNTKSIQTSNHVPVPDWQIKDILKTQYSVSPYSFIVAHYCLTKLITKLIRPHTKIEQLNGPTTIISQYMETNNFIETKQVRILTL